jgi:hypothetical protein
VVTEEPEAVPSDTETPAEPATERTWVRSYSVSRQGSRSSLVVKEEPVPAAEPAAESTWVRSYSVSRQGSRSSLVAKDKPTPAVETAEERPDVAVTPESAVQAAAEPVAEAEAAPATERPWTPSYSVSRQGSSTNLAAQAVAFSTENVYVPTARSSEPITTPTIAVEDVSDEEKTEAAIQAESKPSEETAAPADNVSIFVISNSSLIVMSLLRLRPNLRLALQWSVLLHPGLLRIQSANKARAH